MSSNATTNEPNSALKILVCYHKPYTMTPNDDGVFIPVHAGKALSSQELGMQADNELNGQPCDNISAKNESYCELTVMYWAWKNLRKLYPDVKYIGLHHYRRFFAFHESKAFYDIIFKNESKITNYRINPQKISDIIDKGFIIVPKRRVFPYTLFMDYCINFASEDYFKLKKIIAEKYQDYLEDFVSMMEQDNKFQSYNMFIMSWEDFEKYCEWLFAVLADVEHVISCDNGYVSQKRIYAMIAERLLQVWLKKNRKKLAYRNVYLYDKYDGGLEKASCIVIAARCAYRFCIYLKNQITAKLLIMNVTRTVLKLLRR